MMIAFKALESRQCFFNLLKFSTPPGLNVRAEIGVRTAVTIGPTIMTVISFHHDIQ